MALFTIEEANLCVIHTNTRKVYINNEFKYWVIAVIDSDNQYYDWKDKNLIENPTDEIIKSTIHTFLITNCEKKIMNKIVKTPLTGDIVGSYIS